jgi:hypothetical protein
MSSNPTNSSEVSYLFLRKPLKAHALGAVRDLRLEALARAIVQNQSCTVSIHLHDSYADMPEEVSAP